MVELNDLQKVVVETTEPKVLVNSGAASGKTRCLTERLKYILEHGADPAKVVCITFTNAAAIEMRKRIGDYPSLFIGTVHAYCNRLLLMSGYDTSKLIQEENFDEFFEIIKKNTQFSYKTIQ